jgi:hypothetical protein
MRSAEEEVMRLDPPTHCPDCYAPVRVHALRFYAPRTCPDCGRGLFEAQTEDRRDLLGALSLPATAKKAPSWCPPELVQGSPRQVSRREGFERPLHALLRMGVGVSLLTLMGLFMPVQPWERGALIGFIAVGIILMALRPLRITLEDWRHQRLAANGHLALGNVLSIEEPWYGGRRVRYRYLDAEGRPHEGRIWHPAPPVELPAGSAVPVLYRRGEPAVSVPYPAARYQVAETSAARRHDLAG